MKASPVSAARLTIDSLVRGKVGFTGRVAEMRVFKVSRYDYVAGIEPETGRQLIMYEPEVVGPPRPLLQRTDIPSRLR